ncbi:MMPL family transporter [Leifsonia kafniensis]|uniref:MMPL family transporter n=1 Tax=Leifsonia kafniensis TaxID=475957 RepID=A0ABP7KH89_9MICO
MSSLLYSLGRWAFTARRWVLGFWIVVLVLVGGSAALFNQGLNNAITVPGTESQEALDTLAHTFPQVSGATAQMIVVAPPGSAVTDENVKAPIDDAVVELNAVDQVSNATSPFDPDIADAISTDGSSGLVSIQLNDTVSNITADTQSALQDVAAELQKALPADSVVSLGGQLFSQSLAGVSLIELIGIAVALVVLIVTFGSFVAAGMPLMTAFLGVGISISLIYVATAFGPITSTTTVLALMLGLAVGIDYALFIISRHQEQLKAGLELRESASRAVATAGSAVIFAGLTVMIALIGLSVAGIPFLTTMGIAAAVGVMIAVIVSLTLIPALLGFAGERLRPKPKRNPRRQKNHRQAAVAADVVPAGEQALDVVQTADLRQTTDLVPAAEAEPDGLTVLIAEFATAGEPEPAASVEIPQEPEPELSPLAGKNRFYVGWVRVVTWHPIVTIIGIVGVLLIVAAPAVGLRLALPDAGSLPEDDQARVTYDLISEHFGPGFNGPLIVTGSIVSSHDPVGLMDKLGAELAALHGVAAVPLSTPNQSADTGIVQVIPTTGPDNEETKALVNEIRSLHDHFLAEYGVSLSVTGVTAVGIDVSDKLAAALIPFGLIVVGLSLILLTMVFRSIAVPIKATLGYLLSVAAAFGVVSLVFEDGWFADALNVAEIGPVISFMPIILMGVLFGLAMDYEVFLVSRMREDYVHTGLAKQSVKTGFVGSAKVVTAAAIIMIGVFGAFVPEGDANIKPIALGLAVGVFVDAFLVRMTLVPAVLTLLGDKAWWMPAWLDKALPEFDIEGEGLHRELELRDWPEPHSRDIVTADGLSLSVDTVSLYSDVSFSLPPNGTLIVEGDQEAGVRSLLLTLAGRTKPDAGLLKVAGFVVPVRAASVRSRVGFVSLVRSSDPVADVSEALREKPVLLVIDGLDHVTDASARRALGETLIAAGDAANQKGRTLAIVVGTASVTGVADVIAARDTAVVTRIIPDLALDVVPASS